MHQPIICFEGPSGIGKTTLSEQFLEGYTIVPEVNLLFERPANAPEYWYLERQIDRYDLSKISSKPSILDGDIFQPIWYNWVCTYPAQFLNKEKTHTFYKEKLAQGHIAFPDLYIIFHVEEKELWIRKERDTTRRRRNFEKHLKIIEPLKTYYRFLDQQTDIEMRFVHYRNLEDTKQQVLGLIEACLPKKIDGVKAFEQIEKWIDKNTPNLT